MYVTTYLSVSYLQYLRMTNGSNHWVLHQPDQVSKTETMARGNEVPFVATSDRFPKLI